MVWPGIPVSPYSPMLCPSSQNSQPSATPSSFKAALRPRNFWRLWWRGREALARKKHSHRNKATKRSASWGLEWVLRKAWELALYWCREGWTSARLYEFREGCTTAHPTWRTSQKHQGKGSSKALKLKAHPSFPHHLKHREQVGEVLRHYIRPTWTPIFFLDPWLSESHSFIKPPLLHMCNGDDGDTQLKWMCFSLIKKDRKSWNKVLNTGMVLVMQQAFVWC